MHKKKFFTIDEIQVSPDKKTWKLYVNIPYKRWFHTTWERKMLGEFKSKRTAEIKMREWLDYPYVNLSQDYNYKGAEMYYGW